MQSYLASVEQDRRRQFRRILALSALAHGLLVLFYAVGPRPHRQLLLPAVVQVDLVAAPATRAHRRPVTPKPVRVKPVPPKPKPALPKPVPPKPKPALVKPAKVVLPEKPTAVPKATAKPAPEPAHAADESESYEEMLAKLRKEEGEPAHEAAPNAEAKTSAAPAGIPTPIPAQTRVWMARAKMYVTRAWILQPGFRTLPLEAEVQVRLGPSGKVLGIEVTRGSGNPWFDESVERAIRKASPLPAPPEADVWTFVFRPGDLL